MKKFTELNLYDDLLRGITEKAGYVECTPVQEQTFQYTLNERDVLVQSQTGTGKTAAFLISIFQIFHQNRAMDGKKALVIVPTRELAVQIEEEAQVLNTYIGLSIGSFYGGVGYGEQEKLLREGVRIMIGTPGRLIDFNQNGKLDFREVGILVVDEADRLFDMGFYPDIRRMLRKMVPATERITMLLSATLGGRVSTLAWEFMNNAAEVAIQPEQVTVEKISHELYHVSSKEKMSLLLGILKKYEPHNGIIFTNTKQAAFEVAKRLGVNGIECEYIIGDLPQSKRLRIIDSVKDGKTRFLVATDVAARGLHIDDLEVVIHYDLPQEVENYVHRSGRTARLGKSGKAIALVCEQYVYSLEEIEQFIHMKLPVEWADETMFPEDKSAGMRFRLERSGELDRKKVERRAGEKKERREGGAKRPAASKTARPKVAQQKEAAVAAAPQGKSRKKKKPSGAAAAAQGAAREQQRKQPVTTGHGKGDMKNQKQERKQAPAARPMGVPPRPPKKKDIQSRLDYYREKYGEEFQASPDAMKKEEKKSILGGIKDSIRRIFRKKGDA